MEHDKSASREDDMQTSIPRMIKFLSFSLVLWSGSSTSVRPQQRAEFWPEADVHLTLNSKFEHTSRLRLKGTKVARCRRNSAQASSST